MHVGHTFEKRIRLSADDIRAFATAAGDFNPMHHDEPFARATRFGGLIACGAHPVSLLMSLCGSQATPENPGVGLEFNFRLLGAVRPERSLLMRWDIVSEEPKAKLGGTIYALRGSMTDEDDGGRVIVAADGKVLMTATL